MTYSTDARDNLRKRTFEFIAFGLSPLQLIETLWSREHIGSSNKRQVSVGYYPVAVLTTLGLGLTFLVTFPLSVVATLFNFMTYPFTYGVAAYKDSKAKKTMDRENVNTLENQNVPHESVRTQTPKEVSHHQEVYFNEQKIGAVAASLRKHFTPNTATVRSRPS